MIAEEREVLNNVRLKNWY